MYEFLHKYVYLPHLDRRTRRRALDFIDSIEADGRTNINNAVVEAGRQISEAFQSDPHRANLILLISDGRTNGGELIDNKIDANFRKAKMETPVILHTFSVGPSDNERLLKRLTILNGGSLHHIRTEALFDELLDVTINKLRLECPLLSNIQFNYPDGSVEDLTLTSFPYYIKGQELIVSGRILQGSADILHMNITGNIRGGRSITWRRSISLRLANESQNSCLNETMLAYLNVTDLYDEYRVQFGYSLTMRQLELKKQIVDISKLYHFVTNFTSLLVSENSNERCACPDECVCNSGCPKGSSTTGANLAGDVINPPRPSRPDPVRPIRPVRPVGSIIRPNSIVPRGPIRPNSIVPRGPIRPNYIVPRGPIRPNYIVPRGPIIPNYIVPRGPIRPNSIVPRGPIRPNSIVPRGPVGSIIRPNSIVPRGPFTFTGAIKTNYIVPSNSSSTYGAGGTNSNGQSGITYRRRRFTNPQKRDTRLSTFPKGNY